MPSFAAKHHESFSASPIRLGLFAAFPESRRKGYAEYPTASRRHPILGLPFALIEELCALQRPSPTLPPRLRPTPLQPTPLPEKTCVCGAGGFFLSSHAFRESARVLQESSCNIAKRRQNDTAAGSERGCRVFSFRHWDAEPCGGLRGGKAKRHPDERERRWL